MFGFLILKLFINSKCKLFSRLRLTVIKFKSCWSICCFSKLDAKDVWFRLFSKSIRRSSMNFWLLWYTDFWSVRLAFSGLKRIIAERIAVSVLLKLNSFIWRMKSRFSCIKYFSSSSKGIEELDESKWKFSSVLIH